MATVRPRALVRRATGAIAVAGLLSGAFWYYGDASERIDDPIAAPPPVTSPTPTPTPTDSTPTSPAQAGPTPPTRPATGSSTASPASPTPRQTKKPDVAAVGLKTPGTALAATVGADGTVEVAELVLLPVPVSTLTLRTPEIRSAGRDFRDVRPLTGPVQLTAADEPVVVPGGNVSGSVEVHLATPADRFELRYQLRNVAVRSTPSRAGRALVAIAPLVATGDGALPVVIAVSGAPVLNLVCPKLPLSAQGCAAGVPPRLRISRPLQSKTALVLAQIDLPRPS